MPEAILCKTMQTQFSNVWQMMAEAVRHCPDRHWRSGDDLALIPARLIFQAIQAVDYYFDDESSNYDWMAFGFDWEEAEPEALMGRKEVLDRAKAKTEAWLQKLGDEGLLSPDQTMPKYFTNPLARAIYALRYTQYHLGQLNFAL